MAKKTLTAQDYCRRTLNVLNGATHTDAQDGRKGWLGRRCGKGAAIVNKMLLRGESMAALVSRSGRAEESNGSHFRRLNGWHGCAAVTLDRRGKWRFDRVAIQARLAERTEARSPAGEMSLDGELQSLVSSAGAGFGDSKKNTRVERAAVAAVTARHVARGWSVTSREAEHVGYDLLCRRGSAVEHVEVKGVSGTAHECIVTANEVRVAETDPAPVVYLVTAALTGSPALARPGF